MAAPCQGISSGTKSIEAQWPAENDLQFVTLMYEEVVKGNLVGIKLTQSQWIEISNTMRRCFPSHHYSLKQLRTKCDRLKGRWKKYHMLVTKATGFGFESATGRVVASDDVWSQYLQANPNDVELRHIGLPMYPQLTTIFAPRKATGSVARSSAQERPQWSAMLDSVGEASGTHDHAPHDATNILSPGFPWPNFSSPSGSKRKKPTDSSVANAMNEFALTSKCMREKVSKKEGTFQDAMDFLEKMGLRRKVFAVVFKNLVDHDNRKLFVSVKSDDYRLGIVEEWASDAGVSME